VRSSNSSNWGRRDTRAPCRAVFPVRFRRRAVFETSGLARMVETPWCNVDGGNGRIRRRVVDRDAGRRDGPCGRPRRSSTDTWRRDGSESTGHARPDRACGLPRSSTAAGPTARAAREPNDGQRGSRAGSADDRIGSSSNALLARAPPGESGRVIPRGGIVLGTDRSRALAAVSSRPSEIQSSLTCHVSEE